MLLALSSSQKLGLALAGAAFVVFALVSSMVIPRWRPDFPGRHLGWFTAVAALFTVGMLATVFFVARETGEEEAAAQPTLTEPTEPTVSTETTETEPTATTETEPTGTTETTETTADPNNAKGGPGRCDRGEAGLRDRRVRELSHARRRRIDGHRRTESRRREAELRQGRRAGDERQVADALVQWHVDAPADPGRRSVRLERRRVLTAAIRSVQHGEVSELAEGARLEIACVPKRCVEGSNPSLSAYRRKSHDFRRVTLLAAERLCAAPAMSVAAANELTV